MRYLKNRKGFTLIEMMIVLVIISVLLLIAVPNLGKNQEMARSKGCEATIDLVSAQMIAYEIEKGQKVTDLSVLKPDYVDTLQCPDGTGLKLSNGKIVKDES
ncbi:prepilin-type N-terminal cleavage/methylation domain-containing protein [Bacillus tamaricis]|uniref:ComG operon protein 3 n=2 Tax=Evansella tamaricis TaxID=2069301 RepID=A0ABS6JHA5_9BACI|nr:prepilin-type N-terminal cleavage/methylation domain-containing protein [Evansella tamaricis]